MSDDNVGYFNKNEDPYCYPGTEVLINTVGIENAQDLEDFEKNLFLLNYAKFDTYPLEYTFDLDMLKMIHWIFFKELYDWAGKIRTVEISKGIMFCNSEHIEYYSKIVFEKLKKENYLEGLSIDELADRLAYYLAEVNAIHPFREGNGRTQRKFIELLAAHNGYNLVFDDVNREEMVYACEKAMTSDHTGLAKLIRKNLTFNGN